ncbi:MAG: hypothetical protein WA667_09625 [Candidatus Nitrosopolaris sp.]
MNYPAKNIANKIIRPFYVFLLVGIVSDTNNNQPLTSSDGRLRKITVCGIQVPAVPRTRAGNWFEGK